MRYPYIFLLAVIINVITANEVTGIISTTNRPESFKAEHKKSTLESRPKKKFRAKRKIAGLWDCHPFLLYKSNIQKSREKQIKKQRRRR